MRSLKIMLLGLAIMLATIVIHLYIDAGFFTDYIAIVGLLVVLAGFFHKEK